MNTNSPSRRDSSGEMELENISDNSLERLEDSSSEIINVQNSPKTFFLSAIGKTKGKIMLSRKTKAKTETSQGKHNKNKCIVGKMTAMEIALITTFIIIAVPITCFIVGMLLDSIPLMLIGGIPLALAILAGTFTSCMR